MQSSELEPVNYVTRTTLHVDLVVHQKSESSLENFPNKWTEAGPDHTNNGMKWYAFEAK
jgi:hypothetical protein